MRKKIPVVTIVLVALNVLGLIYEYRVGERLATFKYGMYQGALENGEYVRAIVCSFLHFGILHFGSNMIIGFLRFCNLSLVVRPDCFKDER